MLIRFLDAERQFKKFVIYKISKPKWPRCTKDAARVEELERWWPRNGCDGTSVMSYSFAHSHL